MNRRTFLGAAAAVGATTRSVRGANDRVVVGLIGCGGRGRYVANFMRQAPNVEFAATADVQLTNAERARQWAGPSAVGWWKPRAATTASCRPACSIHWDAVKEEFTGDADANRHLARVSPRKQWDWAGVA